MVPSLEVSEPFMICRKETVLGPDYIVRNTTGGMKSVGSSCSYENLFFEKISPSVSGVILYNAALCWNPLQGDNDLTDWQYRNLYREIILQVGEELKEEFEIRDFIAGKKEKLLEIGSNI